MLSPDQHLLITHMLGHAPSESRERFHAFPQHPPPNLFPMHQSPPRQGFASSHSLSPSYLMHNEIFFLSSGDPSKPFFFSHVARHLSGCPERKTGLGLFPWPFPLQTPLPHFLSCSYLLTFSFSPLKVEVAFITLSYLPFPICFTVKPMCDHP